MSSSRDQQAPDGAADLLTFAREQRRAADAAERNLLMAAVQWAVQHPGESVEEAETIHLRHFGDTGIPVAGEGAPLVAEFSLAEFAAAVGLGPEAGKRYFGHAVELCYRLKDMWKCVLDGDLPAWKARRVAEDTVSLSPEAAAYVDKHVAPVAHKIKPAHLDRLVAEAITRFMPERAEQERREAWDRTHADVHFDSVGIAGTAQISAELDLADAIDLENALRAEAQAQADLGSTRSLDQRRAAGLGNIARRNLSLDFPVDFPRPETATETEPATPPVTQQPVARRPHQRDMVLHLHVAEAAITSRAGKTDRGDGVGRVENTGTPVTIQAVRQWCGSPATTRIIVKPIIDLADHVHVEAYEVADRISEAVALRDLTCVFPWCTRPARALKPDEHPADCDHNQPHAEGGATCTCQIAPLCRRHHRLKTHGGWRYEILEPGSYLWRSPHGYHYLRDHTGTLDVSHDLHRPRPASEPDPQPDPQPETSADT